jgi:hypothetical protein
MLARFTATITFLTDEHFLTADISPAHALLLHFAVSYYVSTFKYARVKIPKALVPTPVRNLFCDIFGGING